MLVRFRPADAAVSSNMRAVMGAGGGQAEHRRDQRERGAHVGVVGEAKDASAGPVRAKVAGEEREWGARQACEEKDSRQTKRRDG